MDTICNPSRVELVVTDLVRPTGVSPAVLGFQTGEHRRSSLPQGDPLVLALGQQAGSRDSPRGAGLRHRTSAHLTTRHDHAPARGLA